MNRIAKALSIAAVFAMMAITAQAANVENHVAALSSMKNVSEVAAYLAKLDAKSSAEVVKAISASTTVSSQVKDMVAVADKNSEMLRLRSYNEIMAYLSNFNAEDREMVVNAFMANDQVSSRVKAMVSSANETIAQAPEAVGAPRKNSSYAQNAVSVKASVVSNSANRK